MSDALTNSEIEDVLTSVRRLVGDDVHRAVDGSDSAAKGAGAQGDRLILTQAQRIDAVIGEGVHKCASDTDKPKVVVASSSPAPQPEPVWSEAPSGNVSLNQAPDFRRLEATIAELEAAVSASGSVFEPDGTETAPASNVTALYAKPSFLHVAPPEAMSLRPEDSVKTPLPQAGQGSVDGTEADDPDDDELFETATDDASLRILVAQIVREELQGQLGERVTLQVRKLVRSEIAKALDSRDLL